MAVLVSDQAGAASVVVNPGRGVRLSGIEGLRAIACLLVLVTHVWQFGPAAPRLGGLRRWLLPNTSSGLTLFFVLSGFLLYRPFAAAIVGGDELPSIRVYLRNRALRIVPAYVAILLLVALVLDVAVLTPRFYTHVDFHEVGALHDPRLLVQNVLLLQGFTPGGVLTGIGPAWSLEVELIFYLLLPVLACGAAARARALPPRRRCAAALAPAGLLLMLGLSSTLVGASTGHVLSDQWGRSWHAVFERSFLPSADLFSFGMAAAVIMLAADDGRLPRLKRSHVGGCALITGLLFVSLHSQSILGDRAFPTAMALTFGLLVLYVVLPRDAAKPGFTRVLETRVMVYLGVISYSVYLWHQPLLFFLRKHGLLASGSLSAISNVAVVLAVTVVASAITYRLVEAPVIRRKTKISAPRHGQALSALQTDTMEAAP